VHRVLVSFSGQGIRLGAVTYPQVRCGLSHVLQCSRCLAGVLVPADCLFASQEHNDTAGRVGPDARALETTPYT
jgi:hypothetical protein